MAKTASLVLLINSLTKAEKRHFKLYTAIQSGDKNYLDLFEIIDKKQFSDIPGIKTAFKHKHPKASFEIASKYLYQVLIEALVQLKSDNDDVIRLNKILSTVVILFEKSMYSESFNELNRLKKIAGENGNLLFEAIANKLELKYKTELSFQGISENELIQTQMKIDMLLKSELQMHQHQSLLHLIKHRLVYKGVARNSKQKDELNDLVVSELALMSKALNNTFESRKIHLLFQSNYCLAVGDYRSALSNFKELNQLFENDRVAGKEDVNYLNCLEGILDSLHTIQQYREMDFYIEKVRQLQSNSPLFTVMKTRLLFLYQMISLTDRGQFEEALKIAEEFEEHFFKQTNILGFNRQAELSLYTSSIFFGNGQMSRTVKYLNKVLIDHNLYYRSQDYKILRMIRLLAHYELSNHDFVKYEISAFKRQIIAKEKTYKLEKLIFKFIQKTYHHISPLKRMEIWDNLKSDFDKLKRDKFEIQILKKFEFTAWVEAKLLKRDFKDILKERNRSFNS